MGVLKNKKYVSVLRFIDEYSNAENIALHVSLEDAEKRCLEHLALNKPSDTIYFDAFILEGQIIKEYKN